MDKKVIAAVIFVLVVGVALGAYFLATPAPQIEQKQSEITVTDLAGRTVTIDTPVERVVITFNFEEYLAVEGGEKPFKKIVGWTRGYWEGRRQWIWEKYTEAFPEIEDIPDVGYIYRGTFSAEKVISLEPDVVIMTIYNYERAKEDISELEQAGIPVVLIDYHTETLETHTKSTLLLGKVLGKEERAQEIVDFYVDQVNKVYSRLGKIDKPKPKVYIEGGFRRWSTYGGYMWGPLIERAGGVNIAKGLFERGGEISPEKVLQANPDVIIVTGSYWPKRPGTVRLGYYADIDELRTLLEEWIDRPGWENLNAVKNGRVYSIHHGLSRHIYDFVAVQFFAKCFYPDVFKDLDPEESFKEFHERFLPVNYSGVWMLSLGEGKKTIMVTDLAGRQVTVKVPVERLVLASSRHTHEFVAVEGGEKPFKKIIGWGPDLKEYDRDTYNKYIEKFPEIENIPDVGYHYKGTFSVEKVIALKPDVVIFPLWLVDNEDVKSDINKLEKAGIPSIFIDFWKKPFENPTKSILLLGQVLGKEERAQEIANFYKEQTNEVYSRIEKIDKPKPKVYVECGWKGPSDYGNTYGNTGWGAMVEVCGGINIAKGIIERTGPINPEYLLDTNPDVIIISGSYWPTTPDSMRLGYYADPEESRELLKAFTKRPGWDTLNATKNHRVHSVFHGFSFRIYNFAGLQAFAKWFYPDEFKDLDPEASLREFHERFLPVNYSGVWMLSLEEEKT